jgi:hypothetical protein
MRTTLDLPDPLLRELKTRAARNGQTLKSLINDLIQRGMALPAMPPSQQIGLPVLTRLQTQAQATQGQNNAQLSDQTLQEDLGKLRRIGFIP